MNSNQTNKMKRKYLHKRSAIQAGTIVGVFTILLTLLMEINHSGKLTMDGIYFCIVSGLVVFIFLTIGLGLFFHYHNKKIEQLKPDHLEEGEQVILEGAANRISGGSSCGGKLILSSRRLIFKQPKNGMPESEHHVQFNEVQGVDKISQSGVFDTGIRLNLKGESIDFTLDYPGEWRSLIQNQVKP